ncbi:hypothetical protein SBOR_3596 [Sclerotinia borealis F-4128]|uniref:Uncharacterized protein n=1 Tax=Sclerotinia borealis (strain F-4128) TaxID=1432307 RepID=W9CJ43_SCLBF|nr:hypothetical protein SBOR_3596 [Sclerotinia borealis F-4128]
MASTPVNPRTFAANTSLGLKSSPSPFPRTPRPSKQNRNPYELGLSLKKVIGTTVSSPPCFDCLSSSRIFAYTAGATVVVVDIDDEGKHFQRFFRASPTAVAANVSNATLGGPSTPATNATDGRNGKGFRDAAIPYAPSTAHTGLESGDSPSRTWSSRERIKAATCVSISSDGRFLAVGETGYAPRVLIFYLQENSSDTPLAILTEHTYGVSAIAFSPDGKYLASLGNVNDGFLHVWAINQKNGTAKLHSSNKCTSFIKQMLWLGGNVVTVGTRHIKVWRVDDGRCPSPKQKFALDGTPLPLPVQPALKTLAGRNCLLGPLVDATFTCVASLSDHRAIVCSEKGDVCLLDSTEGQKLLKVLSTGFPVTCVAIEMETRQVRIGGRNGKVKTVSLDTLLAPSTPPLSPLPADDFNDEVDAGHLCAMGYAGRSFVTIDSRHTIETWGKDDDDTDHGFQNTFQPAHGDAVMGVQLLPENNRMGASFLTWSVNGSLAYWDLYGNSKGSVTIGIDQVSIEDETVNSCQVVRVSKEALFLVSGDKCGVLKILDPSTGACTFETRAHSAEVQDIAIYEDGRSTMVASCSRDRTIQIFRRVFDKWELVQTLEEHTAGVCGLFFAENGEKLISCGMDRTIHIRQIVKKESAEGDVLAAVPVRIITLKAAPVSMTPCLGAQVGNIVVSLLDRTVATYDIASGRLVNSFRATDYDGADAVALDCLAMSTPSTLSGKPSTILAGVSTTDKSVRIYDWNTGSFLDREWGHTTSVSGVALLENPDSSSRVLISTGLDGTIMMWDIASNATDLPNQSESNDAARDEPPPKEPTTLRQPLRKVLSKAELAEFQRASPIATPSGRSSPPRVVRRKTSKFSLANSNPTLSIPSVPAVPTKHFASASDESGRRTSPRNRSRSPSSPQTRELRRPSTATVDLRGRGKASSIGISEFGSLNVATEQACRTLRAYRRKLLSTETVDEECLKELDQELRLTSLALGDKSQKSKSISETVLAGLLDQYSDRLVAIFDEKLRLSQLRPNRMVESPTEMVERPRTADKSSEDGEFLDCH